jgi:hypothetical protein
MVMVVCVCVLCEFGEELEGEVGSKKSIYIIYIYYILLYIQKQICFLISLFTTNWELQYNWKLEKYLYLYIYLFIYLYVHVFVYLCAYFTEVALLAFGKEKNRIQYWEQ